MVGLGRLGSLKPVSTRFKPFLGDDRGILQVAVETVSHKIRAHRICSSGCAAHRRLRSILTGALGHGRSSCYVSWCIALALQTFYSLRALLNTRLGFKAGSSGTRFVGEGLIGPVAEQWSVRFLFVRVYPLLTWEPYNHALLPPCSLVTFPEPP